ncbi:MAG: hypothetical protein FWD76_05870, partial [Firmicutes bacterium]|nr:hypothetical protein [Bacillota bacterium]
MLHNILPTQIADALQQIGNVDKLYEVRLRADLPMMVCYNGKFLYVHKDGFSRVVENAICVNAKTIEEILFRAAEQSLYAVTKQINHGYLTIKGGIRIGIAGEVVYDKEEIRAV